MRLSEESNNIMSLLSNEWATTLGFIGKSMLSVMKSSQQIFFINYINFLTHQISVIFLIRVPMLSDKTGSVQMNKLIIWKEKRQDPIKEVGVSSVSFSSDSLTMACIVGDFRFVVFNLQSGQVLREFSYLQFNKIIYGQISPNQHLAIYVSSGNVRIHRIADGKLIRKFTLFSIASQVGQTGHFALSPDRAKLLAATEDKSVALWDIAQGSMQWKKKFSPKVFSVSNLQFCLQNIFLKLGLSRIFVLDMGGNILKKLFLTQRENCSTTVVPDGSYQITSYYASSRERCLVLQDWISQKVLRTLAGSSIIYPLSISHDGRSLFYLRPCGLVQHDVASWRTSVIIAGDMLGAKKQYTEIVSSPSGDYLALIHYSGLSLFQNVAGILRKVKVKFLA